MTTDNNEPTTNNIDLGHLLTMYETATAFLDISTDALTSVYRDTGEDRDTIEEHNRTVESLKYFAQILYIDPATLDKFHIPLDDE